MNENTHENSEIPATVNPAVAIAEIPSENTVADETLKYIHERLYIDEEWTRRGQHGFTWWAHRLAQHIDAGRPIDDDGIVLTRITSRIPVLRDVRLPEELVDKVLAEWNFINDGYCYVFDPQKRSVDSVQSGLVHEQTLDWRPEMLAANFIIQLDHAEQDAPVLRRALEGRLATSRHPEQGRRKEPDEMLGVVPDVFLPRSAGENLFADEFEFDAIYQQTQRINAVSFGACATGVAIEVPFGHSTALIVLNAKEANPRIGQGLGVFLQLPGFAEFGDCARLAGWLNRKEADGEFLSQCWGAWSVKKHGESCTVTRCQFIPNALHRQGLAMDAAASAVMKLRQLNSVLNPGVEEPNAWQVVADRMGLEVPQADEEITAQLA